MSSKKDSAFYDSSSFPYYNLEANRYSRKTSSDCYPLQNQYQLCSDMEQLKVKSCDVFPRYIDTQNEMHSEIFNYMPNLENRKRSCCESSCISQCSRNLQIPSDPGGGNICNFQVNN